MERFTHLNVASAFSGHYGVTRPEQLAEAAVSLGFDALAITDRDGLYGAVKHIGACLKVGLSPIVGVNLLVFDDSGADLARCIILCHGHTQGAGWSQLCQIVSGAHSGRIFGSSKKSIGIKRSQLSKLIGDQANCTVLITPDSDVGREAIAGNRIRAKQALDAWKQLFRAPGSLGLEIASHITEPGTEYSVDQNRRLLQLADALSVPTVLTNSVRYLDPDGALTADILDSARHLEPLGYFRPQPNAQAWLKPGGLMHALALEITQDQARAGQLIETTNKLAERCRLDPVADCSWGKPKTPEKSALGIDGSPFEVLWQKAHAGISRYYPTASQAELQQIQHRLGQELITINKLGFATYFLTVADVAQMIRDMNIRSQARGSGAGSLTNYLLGISGVDPIEHDLLFERFLSTERSSLPDIDIDVESARRHDIYRAVFKRYGSNRVTLLSMQSKYQGRGAMRDSGLALGLNDDQIDEIAKSMWRFSARNFRGALATKPELAKFAEEVEQDRQMNLLVDITERLDRLPRHISMHPCGVILGDLNLLQVTPIEPSGMGLPMSQFDKDDMDPMGLLKLDILGVRMQSAMAYAVREIERVRGQKLDLDAIPRDDPDTFKLIRTTNTLGIFQIESPGQRELTGKHQPTEFNDLTIQISLFRPGPMKGNMIAPYLDGRHGFAKADFIHSDLEPILRETWGVVIFHEHVIRILSKMTGCSLAKGDEMRRSLENPRLKPEIEKFFRSESANRGYSQPVIERVWSIIEGFSSFGFCKAHGAAFAVPTYQSAWLKTHHPTEFMAGLFTHDPGMYPKRLLLSEARRLGVKLLPVDVNKSTDEYLVEEDGIRMAIHEIQGISEAEVKRILEHRPYTDIGDFYLRARPSRRTLENLALIGALDSLAKTESGSNRGDILARVRQLNAIKNRPLPESQQPTLDFNLIEQLPQGNPNPSSAEQVASELSILKLDVTEHVLELYRPMLDEMGVVRADELVELRSKTEVLVAGVRVATQTPPMKSGKRVVFVTLDDGSGCSDSTFFDEAQKRCSHILFNTRLIVIAGQTRRTGVRGVSIMAENAWDIRELWNQWLAKQAAS
ncbi:DNA polymerase III subunit alpha [Rhodoluna sp. KAS3]|uniref:DNA polymerase III subunit alpha n=1 Tax=Rhodoluna sp. KAS3 TaxID=942880 RepID=UPI00222E8771|nr:DNA polymerase III subunit alpha [Rhodoluna sp. KAS3]BDS49172.1 DNA-directed DNA polymerase [Rhodoluna sp. KAS3]